MVSKPKSRASKKQPSPSPTPSTSSEASSSRSAMDVEETSMNDSHGDEASDAGSDGHDASDLGSEDAEDDSESSSESSEPQRPQIDAAKARSKLHHVAKTLRATAKKTKTFELQKQVKKLKGLQKKASLAKQAELAEKELAAFKSIDINLLAGRALITKMVKAKLLPRSTEEGEYLYLQMVKDEDLLGEDVLSDPVVGKEGDKAVEKAKAKITSSKVLADEVGRFVEELKKLAGIEPAASKKKEVEVDVKGKGKAQQLDHIEAEDKEEEREWSGSEDESDSEDDAPRRLPLDDDDEDEDEDEVDEEELMRIGREKLKALGDLSQWDDMIGSDSAAESDSDDEEPPQRKRKTRHDSDDSSGESDDDEDSSSGESDEEDYSSDSDSDSDSDASSSSTSDRPRKRKSSTTSTTSKPSKKSKKSSSSSTFLPSLNTGFIAGRSDDEWSDAEADLADRDLSELKSGVKKERKNRMGQRARKALYEKKYGKNANHIKMREKQKAAKLERTSGRPAAVVSQSGGRQRPPAFQAPAKRDGGWGGPVAPLPKQAKRPFVPRPAAPMVQSQSAPVQTKSAAPPAAAAKSQEMHPSWIAKQRQKELMAQVKPQGKKVVFD
ncbi:uncharacterized protein UTRI_01892_B [Ustilago trichophora]|uniref:Bud22 domain-containing protein n=1 Tax=Ustilago trichophora TaxID=86804 RepID=A0A5C3DTW8_9BASI|nr:uncharacterized protein UTRI_01892_B [Ustilago trichophora]